MIRNLVKRLFNLVEVSEVNKVKEELRQAKETCEQFRLLYNGLWQKREAARSICKLTGNERKIYEALR